MLAILILKQFIYKKDFHSFARRVLILLLMILCSLNAIAQNKTDKKVLAIALRTDTTVILRWAPTSPVDFETGKKNGYKVERADMNGNSPGLFVNLRGATNVITPFPQGVWDYLMAQLKETDSTKLMYRHFAYNLILAPQSSSAAEAKIEQYNYALMCADRDNIAALGLGLRFEDGDAVKGKRYMYRVTLMDGDKTTALHSDSVIVDGSIDKQNVRVNFEAEELERAILLRWSTGAGYTAYSVLRSDNGGSTYRRLNSAPMITLITGDTTPSNKEFYRDSGLANYKIYHYRVVGHNSFGGTDILGELKAMPRDRTPPDMPTEVHADNVGVSKVKITWKMFDPIAKDLAGFHIRKDSVDDIASNTFPRITKQLLPPTARSYEDANSAFFNKNYYIVEAIDTAGNIALSFSAYCVMIDSTPPAPARWLSGLMDTLGVVTLKFQSPADKDYMGVRLLRANQADHEFTAIKEFFNDSLRAEKNGSILDTVEIYTLTKSVFYKLIALDYHYNESPISPALEVKRPDLVPPTAPVISAYKVMDSLVRIEFVSSSSKDVSHHRVMRRQSNTERWDSISTTTRGNNIVQDRSGAINSEYDYAIQAIDSADNASEPSNIITARRYDNGVRPTVRNLRANYDAASKRVQLSWQYDNLSEQFSFLVYRGEASKLVSYKLLKDQDARDFTDDRIPNSSEIQYAVKVVSASGAESTLTAPVVVRLR